MSTDELSETKVWQALDATQPHGMTPEERAAQFAEWDAEAEARDEAVAS